jgi:hypothetical protein
MDSGATRPAGSGIIPVLMVAVAPTAWAMHLALSYWFVPVSCERGTVAPMHLTTAVAVACAVAAAIYGHRAPRSSTLGRLTLTLGVYFAGVIVMTGLVAVIVDPCA